MKPTQINVFFLQRILYLSVLAVFSSSTSASPVAHSPYKCQPMDKMNSVCSRWFRNAQLPNVFGHDTLQKAMDEMTRVIGKLGNPIEQATPFLCIMYFPPCSVLPTGSYTKAVPLPCRGLCETALASVSKVNTNRGFDFRLWPVMCHTLPSQRCYTFQGQAGLTYVKKSLDIVPRPARTADDILKFSSIDSELGDNEAYALEVVSMSANQDRARRYDITDLGDLDLFHGWADVQGNGAANDYCRVIGKAKRRFLSCHLAGSEAQGHHYVSKLGLDLGYPGTWFMRDMDGDGRDDYCRCVGPPTDSKVTCMKAGDRGFHGSPKQSGSQHSFVVTSSDGCHNKRVNAMFGSL